MSKLGVAESVDKEDKSIVTCERDALVSPLAELGLVLQAWRERRFFPSRHAWAVDSQINARSVTVGSVQRMQTLEWRRMCCSPGRA